MSYHKCEYCENESRFVCTRCKKDICKSHAHYERNQNRSGEWVCKDCHKSNAVITLVIAGIAIVIFIVVAIVIFNNFGPPSGMFP